VATVDHDELLDLRAALAAVPARQRATLVLRFSCDLTVEQTARVLGCSAGTVKSQTAKGLAALRRALDPPPASTAPAGTHVSKPGSRKASNG
jgi:RNA polymerase sigma factor (sigma-70 family)